MRCPSSPIRVTEGGLTADIEVSSVCDVWTADGSGADLLTYTASWATAAPGVRLGWKGTPGRTLTLTADPGARGGTTGRITIGVVGFASTVDSSISLKVVGVPLANVSAISVPGVEIRHIATIDVSKFVSSQLLRPVIKIISVKQRGSGSATVSYPSAGVVDIEPLSYPPNGTMTFSIRLTDAPGQLQRDVTGQISLQVIGRPSSPGSLQGVPGNAQVALSWGAALSDGAPVNYYVVSLGRVSEQVSGTSYVWDRGLRNGTRYTFTVSAHNAVGMSQPVSSTFLPRSAPDAPVGLSATAGDEEATIRWTAPNSNGRRPGTARQ